MMDDDLLKLVTHMQAVLVPVITERLRAAQEDTTTRWAVAVGGEVLIDYEALALIALGGPIV